MSNWCDTMRVPGFSSAHRRGRSFSFSSGRRYSVTTVASLKSALKRSCCLKVTSLVTPAFLALALASRMRSGSMSMPTARMPNFFAAAMGMRPSPEPRS